MRCGLYLLLSFLLALSSCRTAEQAPAKKKKILRLGKFAGEKFPKTMGGFYVQLEMENMDETYADGESKLIKVQLHNLVSNSYYSFTQDVEEQFPDAPSVFKVPSGKYVVARVTAYKKQKPIRVWKGVEKPKKLIVVRQTVSNFGTWTLAPKDKNGIAVSMATSDNTYSESRPLTETTVAAVIDGYTGTIQQVMGGARVLSGKESRVSFSEDEDLDLRNNSTSLASYSSTRQIGMYYSFSLANNSDYIPMALQVLKEHDPYLRQCYSTQLSRNINLRGTISFTMILSSKTSSMKKIRFRTGSLKDYNVTNCLMKRLAELNFAVPKSMVGTVNFQFFSKSS